MNKRRTIFGTLLVGLFFGLSATAAVADAPFEVLAFHPGLNKAEPKELTLQLVSGSDGKLVEYYADVDSVICGDGQCEIITVRLVWDPLGRFLRYGFPNGGNLTKRGHAQFTKKDHAKLLGILKDPESLLRDVNAKDVVSPAEAQTGDEIDGQSGATLLSDKSAIVSGAVYTCYTLWHWANNDIQEEMRRITATEIGTKQLVEYLNSGDETEAVFAMVQLQERGVSDETIRAAVYRNIAEGGTELAGAGLAYFESVGAKAYYGALGKLFEAGSSKQQVLYLTSLLSTDLEAPDGFYDNLSGMLPNLGSYYEVHLMLNLMAERNPDSPVVVANIAALLDNKSFLIGRRAYHFLKERKLCEPQAAKVEVFRTKYADRL